MDNRFKKANIFPNCAPESMKKLFVLVELSYGMLLANIYTAKKPWLHDSRGSITVYPILPVKQLLCSVVELHRYIYVIGGVMGGFATSYVRRLNLINPTSGWEAMSQMKSRRVRHASASLNDNIYVTGGCGNDDVIPSSTAECFNFLSNQWQPVAQMNVRRMDHSMVGFKDSIYAIGGRNETNLIVRTVEVYKSAYNQWTMTSDMQIARANSAAIVHNNQIYVAGGSTSGRCEPLRTVETYNARKQMWTLDSVLLQGRSFCHACVFQNHIHLLGGCDSENNVATSVEWYDPIVGDWKFIDDLYRYGLYPVAGAICASL